MRLGALILLIFAGRLGSGGIISFFSQIGATFERDSLNMRWVSMFWPSY